MSMADQDDATAAVVEGLKRLYHTKLKPLEQTYMFGWFHSPPLTDSEFESKPQVLMCGQYSTGKTSVSAFVLSVCVCVFFFVFFLVFFFGHHITYQVLGSYQYTSKSRIICTGYTVFVCTYTRGIFFILLHFFFFPFSLFFSFFFSLPYFSFMHFSMFFHEFRFHFVFRFLFFSIYVLKCYYGGT